jgi:hypothetical protein
MLTAEPKVMGSLDAGQGPETVEVPIDEPFK